jgi:hypothetical protein
LASSCRAPFKKTYHNNEQCIFCDFNWQLHKVVILAVVVVVFVVEIAVQQVVDRAGVFAPSIDGGLLACRATRLNYRRQQKKNQPTNQPFALVVTGNLAFSALAFSSVTVLTTAAT